MPRQGEQFEQAIFAFYRQLDPNADVRFDAKVPDRQTGQMLQVDVWVRHKLFKHVAIDVHISCKDHARPLDVGAVRELMGEMQSTGAHAGVLYARNGFTKQALEKARANRIACCRMYLDSPPELPSELMTETFAAYPMFTFTAKPISQSIPKKLRWRELLRAIDASSGRRDYFVAMLASFCDSMLDQAQFGKSSGKEYPNFASLVPVPETTLCPSFQLEVLLGWDWYKGRLNAYTLHGSFNATDKSFVGKVSVGPIPATHTPSSEKWERCIQPPNDTGKSRLTMSPLVILPPTILLRTLAPNRVGSPCGWRVGPQNPARATRQINGLLAMNGMDTLGATVALHFDGKK